MRGGSGTEPWISSVGLALIFAAAAMAFSFESAFGLFGVHGAWFVPADVWMLVGGGRFVWHGVLGYVYQGTGSYALPLSFIAMAPVSGLSDHLGLLTGFPFPVAHPSAWLLVGPYTLLMNAVLLHAVRRLAWDL